MIDKIESLLKRWFKATPRDTYVKLLEQFESADCTIATLPGMLTTFWEKVDVDHFENGPSFKDMMYVQIAVRHKNIEELCNFIDTAKRAIIYDDEETIKELSQNQFAVVNEMTMDDYFAGINGGSIAYNEGVYLLQAHMHKLGEVLETSTSSYHVRMLNRMYNDILSVTSLIVNQMKDA